MKFAIITHVIHKDEENFLYAYEPYVREMNLWAKYVDEIKIVAPISNQNKSKIDAAYIHNNISISKIPSFNLLTISNQVKAIITIPFILLKIFKVMFWADHIHLRCPGNIGLLGCFVQILFPKKSKTVKYAGNWDPNSKQPTSYNIQKWILSNTYLTKNCKVLVYGKWKNQSKNILPFFTASYNKDEVELITSKNLNKKINFLFVGSFTKGKQPLLSVEILKELLSKEINVHLNMYGEGLEFDLVKKYIADNNLNENCTLHGNQPKNIIKEAYKKSHFLIFISKSEGWPKVVAEAMFWGCLPISSNVSCIEYMLNYGKRGVVLKPNTSEKRVSIIIKNLIENEVIYATKVVEAIKWSTNFTLDKFEAEIKKIILNE